MALGKWSVILSYYVIFYSILQPARPGKSWHHNSRRLVMMLIGCCVMGSPNTKNMAGSLIYSSEGSKWLTNWDWLHYTNQKNRRDNLLWLCYLEREKKKKIRSMRKKKILYEYSYTKRSRLQLSCTIMIWLMHYL